MTPASQKTRIIGLWLTLAGLALLAYGIYLISITAFTNLTSPLESWEQPFVHEWSGLGSILGFLTAIPGALLALIGGLLNKQSYIGIILVCIGVLFILTMLTALGALDMRRHLFPEMLRFPTILITLLLSLPGLLSLMGGSIVLILWKKNGRSRVAFTSH